MKIKAAVVYEKGGPFVIKEVDLADPKEDEVLVKIAGCGVCHTDEGVRKGDIPLPFPIILGHEGSGIVEKVGTRVNRLAPGDHVIFSAYRCGECEFCLSGHPAECIHMVEGSFSGAYADGTRRHRDENGVELHSFFSQSAFATHVIANQNNTYKIDDDVDIALMGPLSCGVNTGVGTVLNIIDPPAGSGIAVFGCGGVGLSGVMGAKIAACTTIIGVDVVPSRLEMAKELGCTHTINGKEVEDVAGEILRITGGAGIDNCFDTTGIPALINAAIIAMKQLGKCAICAAMEENIMDMRLTSRVRSEAKYLIGVTEGDSNYPFFLPKLVDFYKAGMLPFDKMTKYYGLEEIDRAFQDSLSGKVIKPIIRF
ncbi:MAG: NAD(P)-dependent alcohol dehydrogenase [Clostridiales Family XIII bacterium]|jgi:aryl-alcohol dehydrogenase|nr:NAD(P)-dependent alcohol dehydrogenase [Clostridiales Family XIII bacterium]